MPQNIVTATHPPNYSRMRKMLTNSFSERTLQGQEPVIESYMDLAIAGFRAMAVAGDTKDAGVVLNMLDWLNYLTIDTIGDLGFGESFNCLRDSQYHDWVRTLHDSLKEWCLQQPLVSIHRLNTFSSHCFQAVTSNGKKDIPSSPRSESTGASIWRPIVQIS